MKRTIFLALIVILVLTAVQAQYFPPADLWETRSAERSGFDAGKLKAAIDFAVASETTSPRDQELGQAQTFGREPFGDAVGPFKVRGDMTGVIIKDGYLVAEWGEPFRVDMTHSVTKSFLTATVGLAFDRRLIRDLKSPVHKEMAPITTFQPGRRYDDPGQFGKSRFLEIFETVHNQKIDWDSLLRQTSDWEGSLWGKPDWADRPDRDTSSWMTRNRNEPGSVYEYNDVRVNLLALAALNVIREPLPKFLKKNLMDEIGASNQWRWHGYEGSYVMIDGQVIQSVSGGGHWGGGMFISARDMARFGLLIENGGLWNGKRILSEEFLKMAETPTPVQPTYGFMNFFLNTERKLYPRAPEGTIAFLGNGTNLVFIDKKENLVIVVRWIDNSRIDEFLGLVYTALEKRVGEGAQTLKP